MNGYGVIPEPIKLRNYDFDTCCRNVSSTDSLPDSYMIPEENIPQVHDQGSVGACVAFSLCECAEGKELADTGRCVHYSPAWNYGRDESRNGYKGDGLFASTALNGAIKIGFVPELYFDILKEVPDILNLAKERDDLLSLGMLAKPSSYVSMNYAMEDKRWDSIRQALYTYKRPIMIISDDYFNGSHAIIAIGWSNTNGKTKGRYIQFQNSWGESYGNKGRSYIGIGYVNGAYLLLWDDIKLPFNDVKKEDWFYDDVKSVYLSGLVKGTTDTTFEPNGDFIRGDVAMIISRMLDKFKYSVNTFIKTKHQQGINANYVSFPKTKYDEKRFLDVKKADYYSEAIFDVLANGIMEGTCQNRFEPNKTMTRAEAAAIVTRVIEKLKSMIEKSLNIHLTLPNTGTIKFTDVKPKAWYSSYVNSACGIGLMQGNGDGTFAPEKNITRCEGAAIFHRLFKALEKLLEQSI